MYDLLESAPCGIAACSGYAFAISAPTCAETDTTEQARLFKELKRGYDLVARETDFGQNATTLLLMKRRETRQKDSKQR